MSPREIAALARLALYAVAIVAVLWYGERLWRGFTGLIKAPVETELNVSRANNEGFKAAAEAQNEAVRALPAEAARRKAKSEAAVKEAGKVELKAAEAILATPAPGPTPLERAANRINQEFGR